LFAIEEVKVQVL